MTSDSGRTVVVRRLGGLLSMLDSVCSILRPDTFQYKITIKKFFSQIKTDESAIFNQSFLFDFFAAAVSGEGAANHQCRSGVNV